MSSASELFYSRRSRFGRATAAAGLGFDSYPQRSFHDKYSRRHHTSYNHNHNHDHDHDHRYDLDVCEPLAGSSHLAYPRYRPSHSERESVSLSLGGSHSSSTETLSRITHRPRLTQNDRLPGSVLLARERLLERLRGVSISENRQSSRASSGIHSYEHTGGDFRLIDTEDWEAEISMRRSARGTLFTDLTSQRDQLPFLQEPRRKKPPGLTKEALNCLKVEVFSCRGKVVEGVVSEASRDCSICLESFREGDELICLPCEHWFHSACLGPWLRTCGDCPYCRTVIV